MQPHMRMRTQHAHAQEQHCLTDLQGEKSECYSPVSVLLICQLLIRLPLHMVLLRLCTCTEAGHNKGNEATPAGYKLASSLK